MLESELANLFIDKTTKEAVSYLSEFSIPCAPVNTTAEAASDPHVHEREIMGGGARRRGRQHSRHGQDDQVQPHADGGGPDPVVGQHTREILSGVLGYSGERIEDLSDAGVIHCGDDNPGPADGESGTS